MGGEGGGLALTLLPTLFSPFERDCDLSSLRVCDMMNWLWKFGIYTHKGALQYTTSGYKSARSSKHSCSD